MNTNISSEKIFSQLELGKKSSYCKTYNPSLLQKIPRTLNRDKLHLKDNLPFNGYDLWTFYELSFLNMNGLPIACVGQVTIPCISPCLIESKSFKLYLNSFNFSKYESLNEVSSIIETDIAKALEIDKSAIKFKIHDLSVPVTSDSSSFLNDLGVNISNSSGLYANLERELSSSISINSYDYNPELLTILEDESIVEESLCSNLLKSNCLVTGQPDWGTIYIKYRGRKISHSSLLKYIVSFRNHNEFHEMCAERVFCDIQKACKPEKLTVFARYTRRGGIDINPFRSNFESNVPVMRTVRQ